MFYVIGLGVGDATDITVKGLGIVKTCDRVYLESYTSILAVGFEELEEYYGRRILLADRELVENNADEILPRTEEENVAFLVVGDPFGATTHSDLILRAREKNVKVKVVHNSSILTAVGCCGLQLYRFGETVSIPYWSQNWQPSSFYEKILSNRQRDLHTLCLLDIKVKEPTLESIARKKKEYEPSRFMSVSEAASQLTKILEERNDKVEEEGAIVKSSAVVGLARVGWDDQRIIVCSLERMSSIDLGPPLHCLIVPAATLHPLESDFLTLYALNEDSLDDTTRYDTTYDIPSK